MCPVNEIQPFQRAAFCVVQFRCDQADGRCRIHLCSQSTGKPMFGNGGMYIGLPAHSPCIAKPMRNLVDFAIQRSLFARSLSGNSMQRSASSAAAVAAHVRKCFDVKSACMIVRR